MHGRLRRGLRGRLVVALSGMVLLVLRKDVFPSPHRRSVVCSFLMFRIRRVLLDVGRIRL